jgi:hypothetical protein
MIYRQSNRNNRHDINKKNASRQKNSGLPVNIRRTQMGFHKFRREGSE